MLPQSARSRCAELVDRPERRLYDCGVRLLATLAPLLLVAMPQGAGAQQITWTLVNESGQLVCAVALSPSGGVLGTPLGLAAGEVVGVGASRVFAIAPGSYDLQVESCERQLLAALQNVSLIAPAVTWLYPDRVTTENVPIAVAGPPSAPLAPAPPPSTPAPSPSSSRASPLLWGSLSLGAGIALLVASALVAPVWIDQSSSPYGLDADGASSRAGSIALGAVGIPLTAFGGFLVADTLWRRSWDE